MTGKEIEGNWNEFEFRLVKPDDALALSAFLRLHFFPDEPVCKLTGYSDDLIKDHERIWTRFLNQGLSFMAVHKESGNIAGVRLAYNRSRKAEDRDAHLNANLHVDKPIKISREFEARTAAFRVLDAQSNTFENYRVDNFMELNRAVVAAEFRRNGLMTQMYRMSIELAKIRGFKLIGVNCASPFARKATAKVGFQEVARVYLKDLYDTEGNPYHPLASDKNIMTKAIFIL